MMQQCLTRAFCGEVMTKNQMAQKLVANEKVVKMRELF